MIAALLAILALAAPMPDRPAPDFEEPTATGASVSLSDVAGRIVILEWIDDGCPAGMKHYTAGSMQAMQKRASALGDVWLQVVSDPTETSPLALVERHGATPTAVLVDSDGSMAKAYGASVAPHIVIIDGAGVLRYTGAVDTIASDDPADVRLAGDYVRAALVQLRKGGEVVTKMTRPYGCPIPGQP